MTSLMLFAFMGKLYLILLKATQNFIQMVVKKFLILKQLLIVLNYSKRKYILLLTLS